MKPRHLDDRRSWGFQPWLAALACGCGLGVAGAQTLSTIVTNGPTANRINLVVLSEGYQAGQLGKFLSDATNAVGSLLATPPYQEYRSYFNAFAISVASAQSGSDHYTPQPARLVNTYFNSTFDSYGQQRLITIPPNDHDADYAHGQGKVNALLQALVPEYDFVIMLVNDTQYGGSGGSVVITSLSGSMSEVVVHESGHTLGNLADEYTDPYPGFLPQEAPNATQQTARSLVKWKAWINPSTPIPTPATAQYGGVIGLFQGAQYQTAGWYRPKLDCKMNHLGVPFCEVCREQLVRSAAQIVDSIDGFSPAVSPVSVTATQPVDFSIRPLHPTTHDLSLQWYTNGTAVPDSTNTLFTLWPQFFGNGTHTLKAQVRDGTALVRTDSANVLSNSVSWTLAISISELRLGTPLWLPGGNFACVVTGTAPRGFVLQASPDLAQWTPVVTNTLVGGQYRYTNYGAEGFPARFFRARGQ